MKEIFFLKHYFGFSSLFSQDGLFCTPVNTIMFQMIRGLHHLYQLRYLCVAELYPFKCFDLKKLIKKLLNTSSLDKQNFFQYQILYSL